MADAKDTALTENTAPLGSDLERMVDDPGGTPLSQRIYKGSNNLLPDGYMINGKLSVSVSSNNLTVALKTKSGGNPSTTDPVSVWINGTFRRCTAALSVTINAGTNTFNAGGAELATKEVDYSPYLIWNTTPVTDIMDIGVSRIFHGRVYSDFSGTATNEKYLAFANASTPTSTDDCVNIGRFAATLSAGAGYTWTVPTFTNLNLISEPTYITRLLDWVPARTNVTVGSGTATSKYQVFNNRVKWLDQFILAADSSISGLIGHTLPFSVPAAYYTNNNSTLGEASFVDSGVFYLGRVFRNGTATAYRVFNAAGTYLVETNTSATVPFTWATGDEIHGQGEYFF